MSISLFLSYDGLTDPLGQSQVLPYLSGLSQSGYQVHIISFEKKDRYIQLAEKIKEICAQSGVTWHPLLYHKSPPVLSTLYDLYKMRQKADELQDKVGFQLVHARSYPPAIIARSFSKKNGIPYLFDIRGFWPEERVEGGIWNLKNPLFRYIYNFFKKKEEALYKEAGAIITLTHKAKVILKQRSDLSPIPPITVIPCCADMQHFSQERITESEITKLRESLGIQSQHYVLCYVGSIGTWYMLDEMLQFFVALKKLQPEAKFLFVTKDERAHIVATAAQYNIEVKDLIIKGSSYAEVPNYIAASQASVFFIRPTFSKQASSPTKQGELLAMGKPIVTNAGVGDSDEIVNTTEGGILVQDFSEAEIHRAAKALLQFKPDTKSVRTKTEEIYSLRNGVESYKTVYQDLLKNNHQS